MGETARSGEKVVIVFRALTAADAAGAARVERESFPTPWSREDFWREANSKFACYIVACEDDAVVGFAGCWISFEEAQVTNIALLRAHRERGLGRRLMEEMMRAAVRRGAERMTLEVRPSNAAALHLYERLGFSAVGVRKKYYQDNDEDAILMWHTKLREAYADAAPDAGECGS